MAEGDFQHGDAGPLLAAMHASSAVVVTPPRAVSALLPLCVLTPATDGARVHQLSGEGIGGELPGGAVREAGKEEEEEEECAREDAEEAGVGGRHCVR